METIFFLIVGAFFAIKQMFLYYIAGMHLQKMKYEGKLTGPQKAIGYGLLCEGLVLDFLLQVTVASVLFLELPREYTVSGRLWRLSNQPEQTWRVKLALWIRTKLLDSADRRGYHKG
jgi:hypothetical protein